MSKKKSSNPPITKLTGCNKPFSTEHHIVYWDYEYIVTPVTYGQPPNTYTYNSYKRDPATRKLVFRKVPQSQLYCGKYNRNSRVRMHLCAECLAKNGVIW